MIGFCLYMKHNTTHKTIDISKAFSFLLFANLSMQIKGFGREEVACVFLNEKFAPLKKTIA